MRGPDDGREPIRLTVVMTHPVQYLAPWFRQLAADVPEIELNVLYATAPTAAQQGTGFATEFQWDVALTEGYDCRVLRPPGAGVELSSDSYRGLDIAEIGVALLATAPDVVLVPGWHSITLRHAIRTCRQHRIPLLYRGDSHFGTAPRGAKRWLWERRSRWLLGRFDGWLAVGSRAQEYLRRLTPDTSHPRIFDSTHAVDNTFFASAAAPHLTPEGRGAARRELGAAGVAPVLLFAGKLSPIKRPLDLIRATALLGQGTSSPPQLLIAGGGELEASCRAEAAKLGVAAHWAGFLNQSQLGQAYAAADCLVLPSASESWGLVVNEAMATGLPAVLSDGVGCAPDLVKPGLTGETFPVSDVPALAAALGRAIQYARDPATRQACRQQVSRFTFQAASAGLLAGCRAVVAPSPLPAFDPKRAAPDLSEVRVLASCGGMVVVAGLERQTFEMLRTLRDGGAQVHCLINDWENHRIEPLATGIGATVSTVFHRGRLDRHTRNPLKLAAMAWGLLRSSRALAKEARRFRASHILIPELGALLRAAPALYRLRRRGVGVILRVGNAPERGRFYRFVWSRLVPRLVDLAVANSRFGWLRLREAGVPPAQTALIRNRVARRDLPTDREVDSEIVERMQVRTTLLTLGQIAPFKGTHLAVDAALELLRRGHDLQAAIVGREPDWPPELVDYHRELKAKVAAAGQGERIHFAGECRDVAAIMEQAALLVAPILQEETFGNVVLEAAASGLPAVVFPRGGLPELVEHEVTGWITAEPTLEALLATLEAALAEGERLRHTGHRAQTLFAAEDSPYGASRYSHDWQSLFQLPVDRIRQ